MSGTTITPDGRMRFDGLEVHLSAPISETQQQVFFDAPLTHSGGIEVPDVPVTPNGDEYIPVAILDANNRLAEIAHLIGYGQGSVSGVLLRGQEGTSPRPHPQGAALVHSATIEDFLNVQDHQNDPQPHRPYIDGLITSITQRHLLAHEQDPSNDPHPLYVRKDNAVIDQVSITDTLVIRPNAQLVVQGDLVVEGRLIINGYEIFVGPTAPANQPDNLVWIKTVS
jgi:hypothetical protein